MYAAILAGGVGTRLWPRSRQATPKQFADITGTGRTMIQATVDRLEGLIPAQHTYVLTGSAYAALAARQLPEVPEANLLVEPSGRNTAPAIGLACLHLQQQDPQAIVAVLPADHVIASRVAFQGALSRAAEAAAAGYLVTLGIEPEFPHTGYGYIKRGAPIGVPSDSGAQDLYAVERFLEKPDRTTAEAFLHHGGYDWNGGIFVFRVDRMLAEIRRQMPEMALLLDEIQQVLGASDEDEAMLRLWPQMPSTSIDYGILEGAEHVAVVPMQAGWNDVGSWDALESVLERDESDNFIARGNAVAVDSWGNIVFTDKEIVALIGVDDLVVVEDGNALLIGQKHQMQKVRTVVEMLRDRGRADLT
jgi:mannose-1-phosphate guanylyltransferase